MVDFKAKRKENILAYSFLALVFQKIKEMNEDL
jgi:hypothetical protein